jgi:hypothetical protein
VVHVDGMVHSTDVAALRHIAGQLSVGGCAHTPAMSMSHRPLPTRTMPLTHGLLPVVLQLEMPAECKGKPRTSSSVGGLTGRRGPEDMIPFIIDGMRKSTCACVPHKLQCR